MAHDIFISYSSKDKMYADAVCASLEKSKWRCWIAPRDILPGENWGEAIIDAITDSRVMVIIFSAHANASQQVMREVERAVFKNIPIIPFRIQDVKPTKSMEYFLSTPHWLDAVDDNQEKHIHELLETVDRILNPTSQKTERTAVSPNEASTASEEEIDQRQSAGESKKKNMIVAFAALLILLIIISTASLITTLLNRTQDGDLETGRNNDGMDVDTRADIFQSSFRDDFNDELDSDWTWIREDKNNWQMIPGGILRIRTQPGEIWAIPSLITTNNLKNLLVRPAPEGNFEIITKVDFNPQFYHHQAAIVVYQDDDHYIRLSREYSSQRIRFVKETGVGSDFSRSSILIDCDLTALYLKIEKTENIYTGYYSGDGVDWTKVEGAEDSKIISGVEMTSASHIDSHSAELSSIKVGLYACSGLYEAGGAYGQIDADFDFFEVITETNQQ